MKKVLITVVIIVVVIALFLAMCLIVTRVNDKERLNREADKSMMHEVENAIMLSAANKSGEKEICDEIAENAINGEMTVTFHPDSNNSYKLSDGIVNISVGNNVKLKDCEVLYNKLVSIVGETMRLRSKTYKNSSYTLCVPINVNGGIVTLGKISGDFLTK